MLVSVQSITVGRRLWCTGRGGKYNRREAFMKMTRGMESAMKGNSSHAAISTQRMLLRASPFRRSLLLVALLLCSVITLLAVPAVAAGDNTCAANSDDKGCMAPDVAGEDEQDLREKNFKDIVFRFDGDKEERTFRAYVTPELRTFYNETHVAKGREIRRRLQKPYFSGILGKFINNSPEPLRLYWVPSTSNQSPSFIANVPPFEAAGTATFPTHRFIFVKPNERSPSVKTSVAIFEIEEGNSLYEHDPYGSVKQASEQLTADQLDSYKLQFQSLAFSRIYERITGRQYVALYGRKHAPKSFMWPADYFGQQFTVTTKETHMLDIPPDHILPKVSGYGATQAQREALNPYRDPGSLTLNITVLSVAPRVFEIRNFLSPSEAHHILELAAGMKLSRSTTEASGGSGAISTEPATTRTSSGSWIARSRSPIIDSIIRRSADLLKIDEAMLRYRHKDESELAPDDNGPICERLQLVHYAKGQKYTPHHDFTFPDTSDGQASRFATVLFYLNEGMGGGETGFPRWMNSESGKTLKVVPEVGKAVLFYNQLPDGNYDDLSQHEALPVTRGEKWLTNLWVWDPHG